MHRWCRTAHSTPTGFHEHAPWAPWSSASSAAICAAESSKSNTPALAAMREGVSDLGSGTAPGAKVHRLRTGHCGPQWPGQNKKDGRRVSGRQEWPGRWRWPRLTKAALERPAHEHLGGRLAGLRKVRVSEQG